MANCRKFHGLLLSNVCFKKGFDKTITVTPITITGKKYTFFKSLKIYKTVIILMIISTQMMKTICEAV